MKVIRFTFYDESALNIIVFYQRILDCSDLLRRMSPIPRKIAENIIDIIKARDLRNPRYKVHALAPFRDSSKEFQALVDRYYPKYWNYMKRKESKNKKVRR